MKVSIVIAVLNSHEIVRRQIAHFKKMDLPNDVEIIFVDDGSDPPIDCPDSGLRNLTICSTGNKGKWTQPAARNYGAKQAKGEFCVFTDLDHIIPRESIEIARNCPADVVRFKREAAVLDEAGGFTQDMGVLRKWGFDRGGLRIAPHGNSYIFRRKLFLELGGVDEKFVGTGKYPNREEVPLKAKLKKLAERGKIKIIDDDTKPMIYMFPNGRYCGDKDYNPFGFFHNTSRRTNKEKHDLRRRTK